MQQQCRLNVIAASASVLIPPPVARGIFEQVEPVMIRTLEGAELKVAARGSQMPVWFEQAEESAWLKFR